MLRVCNWKQCSAADHGRISLVKFSSPEVFSRAEPSDNELFQRVTSSLGHAESLLPMLNQQTKHLLINRDAQMAFQRFISNGGSTSVKWSSCFEGKKHILHPSYS